MVEQHSLKIIDKYLNIKVTFYSETSGGQSFNLCSKSVNFFNTRLY
jgi:hypothetical protein